MLKNTEKLTMTELMKNAIRYLEAMAQKHYGGINTKVESAKCWEKNGHK